MRHWIERDFLPGWRVKDWKRRVRIRVETFDSAHVVTWNELTKRMSTAVNLTQHSDISFISGCSVPHKSEIVRLHERYSTANIRAKILEQKRQGRHEVNVFERKRKPIVTVGSSYVFSLSLSRVTYTQQPIIFTSLLLFYFTEIHFRTQVLTSCFRSLADCFE